MPSPLRQPKRELGAATRELALGPSRFHWQRASASLADYVSIRWRPAAIRAGCRARFRGRSTRSWRWRFEGTHDSTNLDSMDTAAPTAALLIDRRTAQAPGASLYGVDRFKVFGRGEGPV